MWARLLPPEAAHILGVPVDNVSESDVLAFIRERVTSRRPSQIVTVNAEYVMLARRDPNFLRVIADADLHTPDSIGVVLAARRRGLPVAERVGGSDLIWSISKQAAEMGHRLFLLGGAPGVSRSASQLLSQRYPGLQICGAHGGCPERDREAEQVRLIEEASPDILLVAFGAPSQDVWISRMKHLLGVPVSMGVGGSFNYVAGVTPRAPLWMRRSGLEWLFRLASQPWRWRRMLALPQFALLALTTND